MRKFSSGENAHANEPQTNTTALTKIVFRRPNLDDKNPLTSVPNTAPHSSALTMNSARESA